MPVLYKHARFGRRILYKIRHHKGHGIHSPFVFNLVNNVIEEKKPYYCYLDLKKHIAKFGNTKLKIKKDHKLSFRLVNYFGAKNVVELGSGKGINTLFMTAHSSRSCCYCLENNNRLVLESKKIQETIRTNIIFLQQVHDIFSVNNIDCIVIDLPKLTQLQKIYIQENIEKIVPSYFILIKGIRSSKNNNKTWQTIANHSERTAMLDLFNIGIIFFNPQLSRWDYQISF